MANSKKKRQTSEQILQAIRERDKAFLDFVEKSKKVLTIKAKDHVTFKREIILEAGALLEQNREKTDGICGELKRAYKGFIGPSTIWMTCPVEWKKMNQTHKGENQYTNPKQYVLNPQTSEFGIANIGYSKDSNDSRFTRREK